MLYVLAGMWMKTHIHTVHGVQKQVGAHLTEGHKDYCYPVSALYCTQGLEKHIDSDSMTASGKINRDFLPHLSLVPLSQCTHGRHIKRTRPCTQIQWVVCPAAILMIHIRSCRNVAGVSSQWASNHTGNKNINLQNIDQWARASSESGV